MQLTRTATYRPAGAEAFVDSVLLYTCRPAGAMWIDSI